MISADVPDTLGVADGTEPPATEPQTSTVEVPNDSAGEPSDTESGAPLSADGVGAPLSEGRRFPGLARVGNLTMWFTLFWEVDNPSGNPAYLPDEEIARLVAQGFTGVRLPVDPNLIGDEFGTLRADAVPLVLDAVARLQAAGLAVVVDLHVWEPASWESPEQVQRLEWIWRQLAPMFAEHDPSLTFLELYNEPGWWGDPLAWAPFEQSMYDVVRAAAPAIPIVLSGPMSSWIDGLEYSLVVDDPNVVYTIHVYDPFPFTHQGADWAADPGLIAAVEIPFPATPEGCAAAIGRQPTPEAVAVVTDYCASGFDEAWVRRHLQTAATWADEHGVELFLGEFGVSPTATTEDAARWMATVASTAEELGIGWAVWGLDAAMGPRRASGWNSTLADPPDPHLLAALGLFAS